MIDKKITGHSVNKISLAKRELAAVGPFGIISYVMTPVNTNN